MPIHVQLVPSSSLELPARGTRILSHTRAPPILVSAFATGQAYLWLQEVLGRNNATKNLIVGTGGSPGGNCVSNQPPALHFIPSIGGTFCPGPCRIALAGLHPRIRARCMMHASELLP